MTLRKQLQPMLYNVPLKKIYYFESSKLCQDIIETGTVANVNQVPI